MSVFYCIFAGMETEHDKSRRRWAEKHPEIEAKPSMKRRKVGHDYQSRCIYMVTLVVNERQPLLGTLCGPENDDGSPHVKPTELGQQVLHEWHAISKFHPEIKLYDVQLMPDHLHGIIYVTSRLPYHLGHVINGFKHGCNLLLREWLSQSLYCEPLARTGTSLWEDGYNDKILRGEHQLDRWKRYLKDNPRRLWEKRQHPDLFVALRGQDFGGTQVTVMGNHFLLDYPEKVQVQCSRRLSPEEIDRESNRIMSLAQNGAVLVSPCISPGEKVIMKRAFECGFPQIVLLENGFAPMQKPFGRQFDACAQGRLLLVAPWPHHNDRRVITREQCLQLNELCRRACEPTARST